MGGGLVMRAAAKVAGIGVFRGGEIGPVATAVRTVAASIGSSSSVGCDDLKLMIGSDGVSPVAVEKVFDDWEFAGDEEEGDGDRMFMELREPMPRLVFGGVHSVEEAKQATSDLNSALEMAYLFPNANNGQKFSDSENVETKTCLVNDKPVTPFASTLALQAFRLLNENPKARAVVASIATDPKVWNAVLENPDLVDFLKTYKTDVVFPEKTDPNPNVNDSSEDSSKPSESKGFMDYVDDIKQKITITVTDMMNTLSDTFQSFFGGSTKDEFTVNPDGTAGVSMEKATMGAFMGLAIMVIMLVVFKRV